MTPLAIIPCKRTSNRVPGKNTAVMGGMPNLVRTIRELQAWGAHPDILVVTDDHHAAELADTEGVAVVTEPAWMAQYGDLWDVVYYGIKYHPTNKAYDTVALAYPNVPVRPLGMWDRLIATLITTGADSVRAHEPAGGSNGGSLFRMKAVLKICQNRAAIASQHHIVLTYQPTELIEIDTEEDQCTAREILEGGPSRS